MLDRSARGGAFICVGEGDEGEVDRRFVGVSDGVENGFTLILVPFDRLNCRVRTSDDIDIVAICEEENFLFGGTDL